MDNSSDVEASVSADIASAEQDVARADLAFSASLQDVSLAGRETVERVVSVVRPVLIGIGLVASAILAIRLLRRSPRTRGFRLQAPAARPLWSELARSVTFSFASIAARRLAERWVSRP